MPSYLSKGLTTVSTLNKYPCCPSTTSFYSNLATKLKEMTESLIEQFSECDKVTVSKRGTYLAEANIHVPEVTIHYEYIIYIRRYGPPVGGEFDSKLLDEIRKEMNTRDKKGVSSL
jgi:hypothetical protein